MKELLKIIAGSSMVGAFVSVYIQKFKELVIFSDSRWYELVSFIMNMTLGVLVANRFFEFTWKDSLWIGFCAFAGAEILYSSFKKIGIMKSSSNIMEESTADDISEIKESAEEDNNISGGNK